jgi:hypothetical protein
MPLGDPPHIQKACPGSSIGFLGSFSSGSIGAFFEAEKQNGEILKFLLTKWVFFNSFFRK